MQTIDYARKSDKSLAISIVYSDCSCGPTQRSRRIAGDKPKVLLIISMSYVRCLPDLIVLRN